MITSSPTIAILSSTRPVISVTSTLSRDGRVLCMIANSASIISAKRTAIFARPSSGATDTISGPVRPRSRKWLREERQRRHMVDRDVKKP